MTDWIKLKSKARAWRELLLVESAGNPSALALLDAAEKITKIKRSPCSTGDSLLMGAEAVLDVEVGQIFYDQDVDPVMVVFYQMHEYAHFCIHNVGYVCPENDIDSEASEEDTLTGSAKVEAYNPKERAEREANIFAREVLLPSTALRHWFLDESQKASEIASLVGVPESMVFHQLSFALLVSDLIVDSETWVNIDKKLKLDQSQVAVAEWKNGPLLVEAGPGTGKTRTLVGRVEFLLQQGVPASSILALTFSNKAAEEMRARVAIAAPEAAPHIWMSTFHAFGVEILRKFGSLLGINADFKIIDPVDAMFLLENNLSSLDLVHYRNLYEPTLFLPDILAAISRAKDELIGPTEYFALAERMLANAASEEDLVAAEKAVEIAKVYKFYQSNLEATSLLDFGDLIYRCVELLKNHNVVNSDLKLKLKHVLVDEYQDINRASGVLLRELVGDGKNLWVVGDKRQSIYRFRGAAPTNMTLFPEDFPGAQTKPLDVNYRSLSAVVKVFAGLARGMKCSSPQSFTGWKVHRTSDQGEAVLKVAETLEAEVESIAKESISLNSKGISFRDQAVLCRSHTIMARIATILEELGIPVLYLGDVFERQEIRDLLSLISLLCEGDGRGLVRVARFPEYDIPLNDVRALIEVARQQDMPFPKALELARGVDDLSAKGKSGINLLLNHLKSLKYGANAWLTLTTYLFNNSEYVARIAKDQSLAGKQRRLAIYQLLQFAHQERTRSGDQQNKQRRFLNYVRRLAQQGADKALRQVPDWAVGINAVRLMTVHASKGLEFSAVFLPYLGKGKFPASRKASICPPPVGMLPTTEAESHEEEEECLFFVAVSRARDYLYLSRARRYGVNSSNESEILTQITPFLSQSLVEVGAGVIKPTSEVIYDASLYDAGDTFDAGDLETHIKCPKKFFYQNVLCLGRKTHNSGYVFFHNAVYKVLRWLLEERLQGNSISESSAAKELESVWATSGLHDHPYEKPYRENADAMICRAVHRLQQDSRLIPTPEWEVALKGGRVKLSPDLVEEVPDPTGSGNRVDVLRFRTGRPTKTETDKEIYALFLAAVDSEYGRNGKMKVFYLSTGEANDVDMTPRKRASRVEKFESAIAGIRRGVSSPNPDERECPRCPHYFICTTAHNA
jgi:superfamily I DNA/RNA helicase/Zn-dependent peptidase ImmA (M78 family)